MRGNNNLGNPFALGGGLLAAPNNLGGRPQIYNILKLENKTVQLNFVNELKKNFDKFSDKLPS